MLLFVNKALIYAVSGWVNLSIKLKEPKKTRKKQRGDINRLFCKRQPREERSREKTRKFTILDKE